MSFASTLKAYRPQKAPGLPRGQREVAAMPRFSDDPFRPAPSPAAPIIELEVAGNSSSIDLTTVEMAAVERTHDFHCVTGWSFRDLKWSGVVLRDLVVHATGRQVDDMAPFAAVFGADERHAVFLTEDLLDPSVLLAVALDGEPIGARHGGSVRLVAPNQYGYKNVKHVSRISFTDVKPDGSFGKKEHLRARIAYEERHSTLPNWMLRLPYRLMVVPTAMAADRSLNRSKNRRR